MFYVRPFINCKKGVPAPPDFDAKRGDCPIDQTNIQSESEIQGIRGPGGRQRGRDRESVRDTGDQGARGETERERDRESVRDTEDQRNRREREREGERQSGRKIERASEIQGIRGTADRKVRVTYILMGK